MDDRQLHRRFQKAQQVLLDALSTHERMRKLHSWTSSTDKFVPGRLLDTPLQVLLDLSLDEIDEMKGVGPRKVEVLVTVLERIAAGAVLHGTRNDSDPQPAVAGPGTPADVATSERVTPAEWDVWCAAIREHEINEAPLGHVAHCLLDVPKGLHEIPLSRFTDRPLREAERMEGVGPHRFREVVRIIGSVARILQHVPPHCGLTVQVRPSNIATACFWLEKVLCEDTGLTADDLREGLVVPLLRQIQCDLGEEIAELVTDRLGLRGQIETLEALAQKRNVSRARIGQLTGRCPRVLNLRWPEASHALGRLASLLSRHPCEGASDFFRLVCTQLFDCSFEADVQPSDLSSRWQRAARQKLTPMVEAEFNEWLGREFPSVAPATAREWLDREIIVVDDDRGTLYFVKEPLDEILVDLYRTRGAMQVSDIAERLTGDERNIRGRIDRDPRLVADGEKLIWSAEQWGIRRKRIDEWMIDLQPRYGGTDSPVSLTIREIVHLVVGGLLQIGISDATVWGVHRFVDQRLVELFNARLPPTVGPFVLADLLTLHSDGVIRSMRRRRLRWDTPTSPPARGKRGWVDYVVRELGMPITIPELDIGLRKWFQDYERYVLGQLSCDDDEEGDSYSGFQTVNGAAGGLPVMFVPFGWRLNADRSNVSDDVRSLATDILTGTRRSKLIRADLRSLPWMMDLCEYMGYGQRTWLDDVNAGSEDPEEPADAFDEYSRTGAEIGTYRLAGDPGSLGDLLARIL